MEPEVRTPPSSQALSAPPAPGCHLHTPHRHVLNTSHICKGVGHMGDELPREGSSTQAHLPQPLEQKYENATGGFFQSAPLPRSESSPHPYYYSLRSQALRSYSVQFSAVTQSCPTLCDPMNHSTPGLPVHHHLPEFTQTHVQRVSDAIQPSHPLSSLSPPAPSPSQHQSLFQ